MPSTLPAPSKPLIAREARPFWFFLPFLVIVLGITSAYLRFPINLFVAALLVSAGAVVFFATRTAAALQTSNTGKEIKLSRILETIDDALISYDENFTILFFNPAAERLFGVSGAVFLGKPIKPQDADDPGKRLLVQTMFPTLAPKMTPRSPSGEYPQVTDVSFDGLELRAITSKIISPDGATSFGFLKIVKNRTREIGLLRSKNEFITIASHQLRTPVSELEWALQALAANPALPDDAKGVVKNASVSAGKLSALVEDLLSVSRIEEGRFGYRFAPTDIVAFLGAIAADALPRAERAGLTLYFDRPKESLPQVMIDPQKIGMALSNLLDNAMRYNVERGEVVLRVSQVAGEPFLEVSVKDSGIGIPPAEIGKLFTKFFRAENAVKSATEGSGLGLYIARNIVRGHGGEMRAESELNRGSTFTFTLPTDPSMVPVAEAAAE